tara:strand:- start:220 stop:621 length:402 start_codon:yes stop_codon:yes gene_type:complete
MNLFLNFLNKIPKKFLIIGSINTLFGYFIGLINYFLFYKFIGIIGVGILNNVISITFSFIMFKLYVFQTKKTNWIVEYIRSYVVYGIGALIGIFTLWITISFLKINIYFAQGISMMATVLISFFGHKKFTFQI